MDEHFCCRRLPSAAPVEPLMETCDRDLQPTSILPWIQLTGRRQCHIREEMSLWLFFYHLVQKFHPEEEARAFFCVQLSFTVSFFGCGVRDGGGLTAATLLTRPNIS